jgi:hypothetical protein
LILTSPTGLEPARDVIQNQAGPAPDACHPMGPLSSGEGGDALTRAANFG